MAVTVQELVDALRKSSQENEELSTQLSKYKELYGDLPAEDTKTLAKKSSEELGTIVKTTENVENTIAKNHNSYYYKIYGNLEGNAFLNNL